MYRLKIESGPHRNGGTSGRKRLAGAGAAGFSRVMVIYIIRFSLKTHNRPQGLTIDHGMLLSDIVCKVTTLNVV